MIFRALLSAAVLALLCGPAAALSDSANRPVREQISEACGAGGGKIAPNAVIERDLTGDGQADLIISREGITCSGGGRSANCGAQLCSVLIYVRNGRALNLRRDMLGAAVTVDDAKVPAIHIAAQGGRPVTLKWNGWQFQ